MLSFEDNMLQSMRLYLTHLRRMDFYHNSLD